jgi:hypothetical protein
VAFDQGLSLDVLTIALREMFNDKALRLNGVLQGLVGFCELGLLQVYK